MQFVLLMATIKCSEAKRRVLQKVNITYQQYLFSIAVNFYYAVFHAEGGGSLGFPTPKLKFPPSSCVHAEGGGNLGFPTYP